MLDNAVLLLFPFSILWAGVTDLLTFTIPNRISLLLSALFIIAALLIGLPWPTLLSHIGAGLLTLLLAFVMFARGWFGGGDAKLLSAAALWLGFENLTKFIILAALLGGALALMILTYRRLFPPLWLIRLPWAMRLHNPTQGIPYGVALAGAGLIVYPQTIWMTGIAS